MVDRRQNIREVLLATFRAEAQEHLQSIARDLVALEREHSPEARSAAVENAFRSMHTLKGAARSVDLADVERACQDCESILSGIKRRQMVLDPELFRTLNELFDRVRRHLADLALASAARRPEEGSPPAASDSAAKPHPATEMPLAVTPETIRVSTSKLDGLLLDAEDLLMPKLSAAARAAESRDLLLALLDCRAELRRSRAGDSPVVELGSALDNALRRAETRARDLHRRLSGDQRLLGTAVDSLQSEAMSLRLGPVADVLALFPGMVRDLCEQQGKEARCVIEGTELEVDRKVLEAIKAPLLHLVRNAVDHGIEPAEERLLAAKPPTGTIGVFVTPREGRRIEVRVEDDGRGANPARLRAAAVRLRLLTSEEAGSLTDAQALELMYRSGVSTSPMITNLSGHGLGLAIVRERAERLGGSVQIETRRAEGTVVRLSLPAQIATFRGVLLRVGEQSFLLAHDAVERVMRIREQEIRRVEGREVVSRNGRSLLVSSLHSLLELPEPATEAAYRICVVVRSGNERVALWVDEVLGDREVVVKELGFPFVRARIVAAAGLLGTGELALILRPADILRSASQPVRAPAPSAEPSRRPQRPSSILVVDDSITTRTMEKNLLEAAGYTVRVAVDGLDAWTMLKTDRFDLVVSDIDMPRSDGFELTHRIRGDRELTDLPVVLVTALESREDREKGVEVGANAYVVKSSFDQSNLLEIIARLI